MNNRENIIKGLELCEIGSDDRCYETECPYYGQGCTEDLKNDILELLKEQDEVVRCKDCKWYNERISMCDNCGLPREQTFFCADGKRR